MENKLKSLIFPGISFLICLFLSGFDAIIVLALFAIPLLLILKLNVDLTKYKSRLIKIYVINIIGIIIGVIFAGPTYAISVIIIVPIIFICNIIEVCIKGEKLKDKVALLFSLPFLYYIIYLLIFMLIDYIKQN